MGLIRSVIGGAISGGTSGGWSGAAKGAGTGAKDWAQGTKAYQAEQGVRQSKVNPWYSAKKQPGSKNEGDATPSDSSGSQDA
jgi:hypothetical protein